MKLSTQSALDDAIYDRLVAHVAVLAWADRPKIGTEDLDYPPGIDARGLSVFFVEVAGHWLMVTAGHVLAALKSRLAVHRDLLAASIIDALRPGAPSDQFPFPLDPERFIFVDNNNGIDLGFVPVNDLSRRALEAGGKEAVGLDRIGFPTPEMTAYMLWGLPTERSKLDLVGTDEGPRFGISEQWRNRAG